MPNGWPMEENRRWRNKGFGMKARIDGPVQAINQEGERLAEGPTLALRCAKTISDFNDPCGNAHENPGQLRIIISFANPETVRTAWNLFAVNTIFVPGIMAASPPSAISTGCISVIRRFSRNW